MFEFFNECLFSKLETHYDYLCHILYGYKDTRDYFTSNELLLWDDEIHGHVWLNDWWEGQDYIEILGYIKIDEIKVPDIIGG